MVQHKEPEKPEVNLSCRKLKKEYKYEKKKKKNVQNS